MPKNIQLVPIIKIYNEPKTPTLPTFITPKKRKKTKFIDEFMREPLKLPKEDT